MSEKLLIVQKFETDFNFKSLVITIIDDGEYQCSKARFGDWCDGHPQHKKKENDKSSRLVVKLVSGDEHNHFDLDSCAREINAHNNNLINLTVSYNGTVNINHEIARSNSCHQDVITLDNNKNISLTRTNNSYIPNLGAQNMNINSVNIINNDNKKKEMSPLDFSLERVKENNARILENIEMLNRTLNYAKEKEIFNVNGRKTSFPCKICGKCFVYETGLKRHYSVRHSMIEAQPRWQIVWTCIECFQVWPRQDLALQHTRQCCKSESSDCVREIKTSSLLQCEFCEKVFTCIPRLLKHSKTHKTARNFECDVCNTAFLSYKAAEQHWYICPWLNQYKFSLPKLLLCNCCDRKFRNYEHLYNHRYKVGHYTTKTYSNQSKSTVCYVYQCEVCGQWFHSTLQLQEHRNQYHPRYDMGAQCQIDFKEVNNSMLRDMDGTFLQQVEVRGD